MPSIRLRKAAAAAYASFKEDPGTSSRLHPLQRPKFRALLDYARPGDTVHISEMFRLVPGTRRNSRPTRVRRAASTTDSAVLSSTYPERDSASRQGGIRRPAGPLPKTAGWSAPDVPARLSA
ncbi:hypothetical protein [Streptomyces sp. NBC_00582]|uniref:hypothetical protein n=1 Tax=Streptomyces sp. NBC_00582 TaxID=2975783 RepID=UPI0010E45714|nr:hypothetical protein [Streptomyces sp. NBC_00582]WUB59335.1 hypothetical protein OG852_02385 [Streptomyces sp. NBC_00582]